MSTEPINNKVTSGQPAHVTAIHLSKNWWILFLFTAFFLGGALFINWVIAYPAIQAAWGEQPLPADWSWIDVIIFDCVWACGILVGLLIPWAELRTEFTEEGISRPALFGPKLIPWNTITHAGLILSGGIRIIEIRNEKRRVKINTLYYKDQDKLFATIYEHVPPSSIVRIV